MGEHYYETQGKLISFSEGNEDIGCLCTFPHNDSDEKGNLVIDEWRLLNLALLGCAVCLINNTNELKNQEYIYLPLDIEKYYKAIKICLNNIKEVK
jgi:hypothetical protein